MLFKISLKNIRRSIKDYAVYFFTLVIGVSIFYVFNAIGTQAAMLVMEESTNAIIPLLTTALSGASIFVAVVLALLIIYASRYLMKRRNREFALYMLLGMGKIKISAILLIETVAVGLGSLFVGLFVGLGLSQLMSAVVANMFEADMSLFRFTVSTEAIVKTILYFAVMYLFVMLFNSISVTKMKLIDLIQSGKRSEKIRVNNPLLSVIIFIIAVIGLGYAYYKVAFDFGNLDQQGAIISIILGSVTTFLIFLSVSGLLVKILTSFRKAYHRGLNAFTFRQISSKVNTMIFAMTVICLMLFVTICALTSSFSVREVLNKNIRTLCPADAEISLIVFDSYQDASSYDIEETYKEAGLDITKGFKEWVHFSTYCDRNFTLEAFSGPYIEDIKKQFRFLYYGASETLVKLSDYNALMDLYGRERLTLEKDEFILAANYKQMIGLRNPVMKGIDKITVFGHDLKPRYRECIDGFIELDVTPLCSGIFIVDDSVIDDTQRQNDYFIGNYSVSGKRKISEFEETLKADFNTVSRSFFNSHPSGDGFSPYGLRFNTKSEMSVSAIGLSAVLTFLGLYLGMVFLIACGAILALKSLSESVDSIQRYEMLRKIGAEESSINRSLFIQIGIFFLLPLVLAIIHSYFGMKFALQILAAFGSGQILRSILVASVILLLIYGGYFVITFFSSKNIIKNRIC